MTLVITVIAALAATAFWFKFRDRKELKSEVPLYLYWGASIMWLVDMIFEFREVGTDIFSPKPVQMLDDTLLGLLVVFAGLAAWFIIYYTSKKRTV